MVKKYIINTFTKVEKQRKLSILKIRELYQYTLMYINVSFFQTFITVPYIIQY